jgi:hypothetical protein
MSTDKKQKYEAPVLTRIGSFEDITQGAQFGPHTDANFPVNTPSSKLRATRRG